MHPDTFPKGRRGSFFFLHPKGKRGGEGKFCREGRTEDRRLDFYALKGRDLLGKKKRGGLKRERREPTCTLYERSPESTFFLSGGEGGGGC